VTVRFAPIDALLLLMAVFWGTNYSIVKRAFAEIDPAVFNAVRMTIASGVFLALIVLLRRAAGWRPGPSRDSEAIASVFHSPEPITPRDWAGLAALGIVGHFLYQYFFINGLALTSVANSSLMLAATPVLIALVTALVGEDRISALHWLGAVLSVAGIYVVVGQELHLGAHSVRGDLLMAGAVCCWAAYTIAAGKLMERHSPLGVTGISMAIGTVLYVAAYSRRLAAVDWPALSISTWGAIVYSAVFALCICYTIWYAAVRAIGSSRTAVYSNLVPLVAMLTAVVFLGEPLSGRKVFGAAAVLSGVALTRVRGGRLAIPAEE
jgi:drug/metabolite transporter (DMT)-like permease